jgi:hypothetical protein
VNVSFYLRKERAHTSDVDDPEFNVSSVNGRAICETVGLPFDNNYGEIEARQFQSMAASAYRPTERGSSSHGS